MEVDGPGLRQLALTLCSNAPDWALRSIPGGLGVIFWGLAGRHRRGVHAHLREMFGERPRAQELRDEIGRFVSFARSFSEGLACMGPRAEEIDFEIEEQIPIAALRDPQQGCIVLTAHTTGLEMTGAAFQRAFKRSLIMVMRAEPNARAREISDTLRARAGIEVMHVGDDPLSSLDLARRLRAGAIAGIQCDRVPKGARSITASLFQKPFELPQGPFSLAAVLQVPLIPIFTRRVGFLRVAILACEPILLPRRPSEDTLSAAALRVSGQLEAWVRAHPTEWLDWGDANIH